MGKYSFLGLVVILLVVSCRSKKASVATENIPEKSTRFLLKKLGKRQVDFDWLSAKAKIKYKDDYQRFGATATIRMRKDSVLWFAVKKAGVEAARVQITKDSVYIINRLNKEYMVRGLDFFTKEYNLPAEFDALQTIVFGNALFLSNIKPESEIKNNQYRLHVEHQNVRSEYWIEGGTYNLAQMTFSDIRNEGTFDMNFGNYEDLEDNPDFSYFRNLNVKTETTGEVNMTFKLSKVEINEPKNIKFSIPSRYERK